MELQPAPLTAETFAAFGEVIELESARQIRINQGLTTRYHDLFEIDVNDQGGKPIVNVFRTSPLPLPHQVTVMERHPLGSQAFVPLGHDPFLVLVANAVEKIRAADLHLFITNGKQGINLRKNTWHHFQIVIGKTQSFLVIDRGGRGNNLVEAEVADQPVWIPAHFS